MSDDGEASIVGEIDTALPRGDLARLLAGAGFAAEDGVYALRLRLAGERVEFARDDVGYILCCGFETAACRKLLPDFSDALGKLGLRHRFEVYADDDLVEYRHHQWPQDDDDNDSGAP